MLVLLFSCVKKSNSQDNSTDIRKPSVAGSFYPANESDLKRMINDLFLKSNVNPVEKKLRALIVPHAGYIYSGPLQQAVINYWRDRAIKKSL
jgi:hypothetical protein